MYKLYRLLSPYFKAIARNLGLAQGQCRFTPTCSLYAKQAFSRHNPLLASWLTLRRMLQCHPWGKGGYDPVP